MSYPNRRDPDFAHQIRDIFTPYKIHKETKTAKELCYPKKYKLQKPQTFVGSFVNPKTPYRDLFIYHKIGAGKTCASIQIGETWKMKKKIMVVVPASLIGNYRDELRSLCANDEYLTSAERQKLKTLSVDSVEYNDIMLRSDIRINKYYKIMSYQKFINLYINKRLDNVALIIDEVQNIVSETGTMYKAFTKILGKIDKKDPIILLSATPIFDKPVEIALTLNLLRLPQKLPIGQEFNKIFLSKTGNDYELINTQEFVDLTRGFASYYSGAHPKTFPKRKITYVKCEMSEFQYRSYLSVLAKEGSFKNSDIFAIPNNFFISSRSISNIAFPNKKIKESGYQSLTNIHMQNLKKYSMKFYKVLKNIKTSKGPVFIYSNFKEYAGIKTFVKILKYFGYKDYDESGVGKNRFAIWSGDQTLKYRNDMKKVFNDKKNINGDLIKIIMGSPAIKEGVSLLRVRQVHILEPYWNISRLEQIIGRAFRYCSHKDLPVSKRAVEVFLYMSVYSRLDISIDEYIYQLAHRKQHIIKQFETLLKRNAVDCFLNMAGNNIEKNDKQSGKLRCF